MSVLLLIVAIFIVLGVLVEVVVLIRKRRRRLSPKQITEIQKNWKQIIRQKDHRHAIMDADKLLDHALYLYGYRGNLGSKLKQANHRFKNVNKVWAAHKVRNNIAHKMNFKVDEKTYRASMLAFKNAFKDLKIF